MRANSSLRLACVAAIMAQVIAWLPVGPARSEPPLPSDQCRIRLYDDVTTPLDQVLPDPQSLARNDDFLVTRSCSLELVAWEGQDFPGEGLLDPWATTNPPSLNDAGTIAFTSFVAGSDRNQGVFKVDADGPHPIAVGCGGLGGSGNPGSGCGDPTPIGGTFSGFFQGSRYITQLNERGDVLFICDVDGGEAPRALFFYEAASDAVIKVAAVGDPSPIGGTFSEVGLGSIDDSGTVVFLARSNGSHDTNIFMWDGLAVTKLVAVGDPGPDGGTIFQLGTQAFGYPDGTVIPVGPIPSINSLGQVVFRANVTPATQGFVLWDEGALAWYVKTGDPTPDGGVYTGFMGGACLNDVGEIAYFGSYEGTHAWFVGRPGSWRKALGYGDTIGGASILTLAISSSAAAPLNDDGLLTLWAEVLGQGAQEVRVLCLPQGDAVPVAMEGDPAPTGGTFGMFSGWPSLNDRDVGTLAVGIRDAPEGIENAYHLFSGCDPYVGIESEGELDTVAGPLRVRSDPGRGSVVLGVRLDETATIRLKIFDVSGRLIETVHEGVIAGGDHAFRWNGRGADGSSLAGSGLYLAVLEQGGRRWASKIMLLR